MLSTRVGGDTIEAQKPRVNHRYHLGDLLSAALARYRARRETELREYRR